jgi:hypothetical protein
MGQKFKNDNFVKEKYGFKSFKIKDINVFTTNDNTKDSEDLQELSENIVKNFILKDKNVIE